MKKLILLLILFFLSKFCIGQWTKLSVDTMHFYSTVEFINSDTGFVAGIDWYNSNYVGVIIRTFDGGDHWDTTRIDPGFWIMSLHFMNDSVGYAVGQDGIMLKTTNKGDSWSFAGDCSLPEDIGQFWFLNPDSGFFLNFNGNLLYTNSWTLDTICSPTGLVGFNSGFPGTGALRFIDSDNGYVAGGSGRFSRTSDGGTTWQSLNCDSTLNILSGYMVDTNNAVIVGEEGKVTVTQNGGATWSPVISISPHPILDIMMLNSQYGYAVGGADLYYHGPSNLAPKGMIWKTADGGYSWSVDDSSWFDQLTAVEIVNDSLAFAVGYSGLVLRNRLSMTSGLNNLILPTSDVQVYPNPFDEKISVNVSTPGTYKIEIYDLTSRILLSKTFNNQIVIPAGQIPAGCYLYRISGSKGLVRQGKLVKLK